MSKVKAESVRLADSEWNWLDDWCSKTGQDRSLVLRAAARMLTVTFASRPLERSMLAIADLGNNKRNTVETKTLALMIDAVDLIREIHKEARRDGGDEVNIDDLMRGHLDEDHRGSRKRDAGKAERIVHGAAQDEKQATKGTTRKAGGAK